MSIETQYMLNRSTLNDTNQELNCQKLFLGYVRQSIALSMFPKLTGYLAWAERNFFLALI